MNSFLWERKEATKHNMFSNSKIFSQFPEVVSYIGTRDILLRAKQFHDEIPEIQIQVKKLEETFGFSKAFFLAQCQSTEVVEITQKNLQETLFADACFTKLLNISLNVVVADCVPILLYDWQKKIVGVIHAGWRGSAEKILQKTLEVLRDKYASEMKDIALFIWPSICGKCYEIGIEVASLFPNSFTQVGESYFLDLKKENLSQALAVGILRENIEISLECTHELPETYFSYRREKQKANFVCGIGMKK